MREKLKLQACISRFFSEGSSIFVVQRSNNNLDPAAYTSVNWKPYPTCHDTEDILQQETALFKQVPTKIFSFGVFFALILDTASYPPFAFSCLLHQQSWGSQVELKQFPCPCETWGSTCNPPTPLNQSTQAPSLPLCALEKFPLQNLQALSSHLSCSSEWFLEQLSAALCKNSGN